MPLYEFKCATCGERFEIVSSHEDSEANAVCPACGAHDAVRVFGGFTVGISRTKLNPGHFERQKGKSPSYEPPSDG